MELSEDMLTTAVRVQPEMGVSGSNRSITSQSQLPLVTIGLPVFNGADTLCEALATLVNQDYQNLRIIISDNASTDSTLDICERFAEKDPRISIIRKRVNEGPVENFRTVLNAADSEFFMWAAADDYWNPEFVSRLLPLLLADAEIGVAMSAVDRRYPDGTPFDLIRFTGINNPNTMGHYQLLRRILSGAKYNLFIYGLYRTNILQRAMNNFPTVLGGDRLFICQLALACRFAYVDDVLLTRTHSPKHCDVYVKKLAEDGTLRRQLAAFAAMMLRSQAIPWWRKAYTPLALIEYLLFGIRQKRLVSTNMLNRFARALYLSPKQLVILIGALGGTAVITALSASLWASAEFAIGSFGGLSLITVFALLNRRWFIRLQKSVSARSDAETKAIRKSLKKLWHEVERARIASREDGQARTLRELRYLTDTLLHPDLALARVKENSLSDHVVQRIDKHRKTVCFARNLEESKIREAYLQELFPGIENLSLPIGVINELTGHANKVDMLYVSAVAKYVGARKMFEFGTYMGRTTFYLAHNSPEGEVFTLNLPPEKDARYAQYLGVLFKDREEEKRIVQIHTDSREFDTEPYRKQFDFVFVDGDHSYEMVKNDTKKAFELLKPGGVIMWHDYAPKSEGLVRFFKEFTQERPLFRIKSTCLLIYIDGVDVMAHDLSRMPDSMELKYREENPYLVESIYHS